MDVERRKGGFNPGSDILDCLAVDCRGRHYFIIVISSRETGSCHDGKEHLMRYLYVSSCLV